MHSHVVKRWWVAIMALMMVFLGTARPAFAQGDTPIEGVHYRFIKGPNPDWTYVRIEPTANLHTPELVRQLKTDMFTLRVDNPTATLAVCKKGKKYKTSPGISDPPVEGRRTNGIWNGCPEDKKYVYVVPGEKLVLKGKKYLSFDDEQRTVAAIRACTTPSCVMGQAQVLGANVSGEAPSASSPAAAPTPDPTMAKRVALLEAQNAKLEAEARAKVDSMPIMDADDAEALSAAIVDRDRFAAQASTETRNKTILFGLFLAAVACLVFVQLRNRKLARVNRFYLMDKQNLSREADSLRKEPARLHLEMDKLRVELEGKVVAKANELKESLAAKDKEVVTYRQSADTHQSLLNIKEADFRQLRMRFAHFIMDLHMKLRGGTLLAVSDTSDLTEEAMEVLGLVDAKKSDLADAISRLGIVVDGEGVNTTRPFNIERLHEITDELVQATVDLEPLFVKEPPSTLVKRVQGVSSDSTLAHFREKLDQLVAQVAARGARVDVVERRVVSATTEEEYGALLTENAMLTTRLQVLEAQLAHGDRPPGTQPFPAPMRTHDEPEIHVTHDVDDDDDEHDRVTVVTNAAERARPTTTLVPRDHRANDTDIRSDRTKSAFEGALEFAQLLEGHVVWAIGHKSEIPIFHGIYRIMGHLRLRCMDVNGQNVTCGISDLNEDVFRENLRVSAPTV